MKAMTLKINKYEFQLWRKQENKEQNVAKRAFQSELFVGYSKCESVHWQKKQ